MVYNYEKDIKEFEKKHGKVKFTAKLLKQYTHCKNINNNVAMTEDEEKQFIKADNESKKHVMDLLGSKKVKKTKKTKKVKK